jgi:IrrE N-terminal-like domain
MFVFDVSDPEPGQGAPLLPRGVECPFEVEGGDVGGQFAITCQNSLRDGVQVSGCQAGSQGAGCIRSVTSTLFLNVLAKSKPKPEYVHVPKRYEVLLNSDHSVATQYCTLVHELAHLYCGHLGTPNPEWWPDRRYMRQEIEEFEAESVCYLVCERSGIKSASAEYLASYIRMSPNGDTPQISLDCVMKAAGLIEQMGKGRLEPRKATPK